MALLACLITELGDPARFDGPGRYRELRRRNPADPAIRQETISEGTSNPSGNTRLCKALLDGGSATDTRNARIQQYYERLHAAGRPGKVAAIAAMRKLLIAVWSVATHRKPFVPGFPASRSLNHA